MRIFYGKSSLLAFILAITVFFSGVPFFAASAANDLGTPVINKISDVTSTTVLLPIHFKDLKKKDVVASIRILNKSNDKLMTQKQKVTLSRTGRAQIKVINLAPDTRYSFKVKIRRETSRSYSNSSDPRTATTLK